MSDAKHAVVFIRARHVGYDAQAATETQITAQRELCEAAAQELNATILREYVEHGGTDRIERRPIVRQMLAELGQVGDVDYVIAYGADRLARRTADFARIEVGIAAAGAELVFAGDNPASLPAHPNERAMARHIATGL